MESKESHQGVYKSLCSSETLRSGTKGFFRDFSESVMNELAGEAWIGKIFGRLSNNVDRVRVALTDPRLDKTVSDTLGRVKYLYREKDATIARSKRLEALEIAAKGDHERALVLFSQSVLRAPATGKFPLVDEGFGLPLGLLARADTLMALGDYEFALEDLSLASDEELPQTLRVESVGKMEKCNRLLRESDNKSSALMIASYDGAFSLQKADADQSNKQFKTRISPSVAEGPSTREELSGASKLIDIVETTSAGKHAVAISDDVKPGDVLASEAPLASCLLPQFYGTHCQHCFTRLRAPLGCPVCSSVAFCGRACRDQALATYHKYECKILALFIGSGMSILSTLALRMVTQEGPERCRRICEILKKHKFYDTNSKNCNVNDNKDEDIKVEEEKEEKRNDENLSKSAKRRLRKKKLKDNYFNNDVSKEGMMSNEGETTNEIIRVVDMRAYDLVTLADKRCPKDYFERTLMALFLLKGLQKVRFFDTSSKSDEPAPTNQEIEIGALLLRNLELLQFNAHEIYETRLAQNHRYRGNKTVYIGVAIYPSVARFNHDCYPAVTRYFAGRNIVIRALRPLKIGDVVAENYGPIFTKKSVKDRQRSLAARYWFRCSCLACVQDWPGFFDDNLTNHLARLRCTTNGCKGLLSQPRIPERSIKCSSCRKMKNLQGIMRNLKECEAEYARGMELMEEENSEEAMRIFAKALTSFHRVATPPHRDTHLAEIAFAACMADSGNTWRPILL